MAVAVETRPGLVLEPELRETIVEARNLVKTYDTGKVEVHALRGVTLGVKLGEMVAIMGPSGSGKTTLLNCLSGLDSISGGNVLIEGVSLGDMSDRKRTDYRAKRMGFVFQFYNLMPVLSAVENVELPRAVVERRQQIGVLRAIGFRQGMVQAVFLIESSFIALTSIAAGTILGLILAENIVHDSAKQPSWENLTLVVPWGTFAVVFLAVYAVALAATLAPAIRASRVHPAEALRYQ
jgi:hypothetical protein